jgi:hypothetical protein
VVQLPYRKSRNDHQMDLKKKINPIVVVEAVETGKTMAIPVPISVFHGNGLRRVVAQLVKLGRFPPFPRPGETVMAVNSRVQLPFFLC